MGLLLRKNASARLRPEPGPACTRRRRSCRQTSHGAARRSMRPGTPLHVVRRAALSARPVGQALPVAAAPLMNVGGADPQSGQRRGPAGGRNRVLADTRALLFYLRVINVGLPGKAADGRRGRQHGQSDKGGRVLEPEGDAGDEPDLGVGGLDERVGQAVLEEGVDTRAVAPDHTTELDQTAIQTNAGGARSWCFRAFRTAMH